LTFSAVSATCPSFSATRFAKLTFPTFFATCPAFSPFPGTSFPTF